MRKNPLINYNDHKHIEELLQKWFDLCEYLHMRTKVASPIDVPLLVAKVQTLYDLFFKYGDYNQTHADQVGSTQGIPYNTMEGFAWLRSQREHHAKDQYYWGYDWWGHNDVDAHDVTE